MKRGHSKIKDIRLRHANKIHRIKAPGRILVRIHVQWHDNFMTIMTDGTAIGHKIKENNI